MIDKHPYVYGPCILPDGREAVFLMSSHSGHRDHWCRYGIVLFEDGHREVVDPDALVRSGGQLIPFIEQAPVVVAPKHKQLEEAVHAYLAKGWRQPRLSGEPVGLDGCGPWVEPR